MNARLVHTALGTVLRIANGLIALSYRSLSTKAPGTCDDNYLSYAYGIPGVLIATSDILSISWQNRWLQFRNLRLGKIQGNSHAFREMTRIGMLSS